MESSLPEPPLLHTKVRSPPLRPQAIVRRRLLTQLNEAWGKPLTLISAPAGFGKTTLVSQWASEFINRPAPKLAWLSLDPGDNDVTQFLVYCIAALQTVAPALGQQAWARARWAQPASPQVIVTLLLNESLELTPESPIGLVLDDYHLITSPVIHDTVAFLLDRLPPTLRLILTTREDPPLPLARWRMRHQLAEIRAGDLRFTPAETIQFLNEMMRLNLSAEAAHAFGQRSEGWIAGLQLAALVLRAPLSRPGRPDLLAAFTGSHRHVLDYFSEEVLSQQSPGLQDFLLQTSLLDRLSAPLCAETLGQAEWSPARCQSMLEQLDHANLFLSPLDDSRHWYRYHQLFAEALQTHLRRTQPSAIPGLHRRASAWYETQNAMDEAIRHAVSAQDFQRAAGLIETRTKWWVRNEVSALTRWLSALPDQVIRERPRLLFNRVWELLSNSKADEAAAWLSDVDLILGDPRSPGVGSERTYLRAEALTLRSAIARQRRDMREAIHYGQQALELLPPPPSDLRAVTALHLGNAYLLQGDLAAATQTLQAAVETALAAGHATVYLSAQHSLATISLTCGRLREAEARYRQAIRYAQQQPQPILTGLQSIGLCEVYREWNDFPKAEVALAEGLALAEQGGGAVQIRLGYLAAARLKQSQGDWADAESYLNRAEQLTPDLTSWNAAIIAASRARLALACADPATAVRWAKHEPRCSDDLAFVWDIEQATLARVGLATGDYHATRKVLNHWRASAESGGRAGRVLEADMLLALLSWNQGRRAAAQALISPVLNMAASEGYVRLFVEEGAPMLALLTATSRQARPALGSYIQRLLAAFPAPAEAVADSSLTTLSEREVEVLRLLAEGRSYKEIAKTLVLAVSTVQSYVRNLYRKLDAHSGREAVARARALKLIP